MSTPSHPVRPRPTSAQREAAEERLRQAAGDGVLTLEEYGDRVSMVLAADSGEELAAVTADLPVPQVEPIAAPARQRPARRWLVAVMSGHEERGQWRPAAETNALAIMGGVEIDLRQALVEEGELAINAYALMGGIEITVPEGVEVEMTGFAFMGGRENRTRQPASPAAPLLRVRGYALMGGIEVHNPKPVKDEQGSGSTALEAPPTWRSSQSSGASALPARRRSGGLPAPIRRLAGLGIAAALVFGVVGTPVRAVFGNDKTAVMGSEVYLPDAAERAGDDEVEVGALMGSVEVVLPEGYRYEGGNGGAFMGSVEPSDEVQALPDDLPAITVNASAFMGSVQIVTAESVARRAELRADIERLEAEEERAEDADNDAQEARLEDEIRELEDELDALD